MLTLQRHSPGRLLMLAILLGGCLMAASGQRTELDNIFRNIYRPFRLFTLQLTGRSGEDPHNVQLVRSLGKTQRSNPRTRSLLKFCDPDGPGRRSDSPPTSIHRLRPGDIDIIMAMGDSLTAGNGAFASTISHITVENRGIAWSIGGKANWRKYLTLPNILKEFNPQLYGYSLSDSLSSDRNSRFNVAELGAMSRDMPFMARVLVKRLQRDPHVNMTGHWKLMTLLVGNNDFCSDMCYYPNPKKVVDWHERNMLETLRYLRDNVPRLMVNLVPAPNLSLLTRMSGLPYTCSSTLRFECPCLVGKPAKVIAAGEEIMKAWVERDKKIAAMPEFNTETFTINIQPFTQFGDLPTMANGQTDTSVLSTDCFHLSQKGHALAANALWNNLFEMPDEKSLLGTEHLFEKFRCPTEEHPYILTRVNMRPDFER